MSKRFLLMFVLRVLWFCGLHSGLWSISNILLCIGLDSDPHFLLFCSHHLGVWSYDPDHQQRWQHNLIPCHIWGVSRPCCQRGLWDERVRPPQQLHHWGIQLCGRMEWENWWHGPFLGMPESELPWCSWPEHTVCHLRGQDTSGHICACRWDIEWARSAEPGAVLSTNIVCTLGGLRCSEETDVICKQCQVAV